MAENIHLGSYETGIQADRIQTMVEDFTTLDIPWQYNDFRNLAPYTSIILYIPAYGYVELNPADLIGMTSLKVKVTLDGATGTGVVQIDRLLKVNVNFGVDVQVGSVGSNALGYVTGIISSGMGLLTKNYSSIASGMFNSFIAGQERQLGAVGSNNGVSSALAGPVSINDWYHVHLWLVTHNTTVEPASVAESIGRPLNKVIPLNTCTGYVQTVEASVKCDNANISDQINTLLEGGVYIE